MVPASLPYQDKASWSIQEPNLSVDHKELRNGMSQIPIRRTAVKFPEGLWYHQLHWQSAVLADCVQSEGFSLIAVWTSREGTQLQFHCSKATENQECKVICSSTENLRLKRKPNSNGNIAFLNKRDITHFNSLPGWVWECMPAHGRAEEERFLWVYVESFMPVRAY